jgi:hypothetical protein
LIERNLTPRLLQALRRAPAVHLAGARQCGKSTLVRALAEGRHRASYRSLDDLGLLSLARSDPSGFVAGLPTPVVLDEIQRCPELLLPIKAAIDADRRPGRYLLTGSTSIDVVPAVAEALVGRVELFALHPFSQGELEGRIDGFVDALFGDAAPPADDTLAGDAGLAQRISRGGFPEVQLRRTAEDRAQWFEDYLGLLLAREVSDLARIEGLRQLPDLARLIAARTAALANDAELSRTAGMPQTTLRRYEVLLEAVYLLARVPAWSSNRGKRLARSPKLFLQDPGLTAHLRGELGGVPVRPPSGPLLEAFVRAELEKQLGWSRVRARLHHFRTHAGAEVDFVLEDAAGRCAGVEVKSAASVRAEDFDGLKRLQELAGEAFVRGVVLHPGRIPLPFGPRLHALPIQALWTWGGEKANHTPREGG